MTNDPTLDRALGRIEGELRGLRLEIAEIKAAQLLQTAQISSLDNWRFKVGGVAAGVAAFISFLVAGLAQIANWR